MSRSTSPRPTGIVGFQHKSEAERFLGELRERFRKFHLELHPDKTRLLEFGPFADENRRGGGRGKPETFIQRHRLGMGWHYLWEYDPPIDHQVRGQDGAPYFWRECGETSEGSIMFLADCLAHEHLGTTARELYRLAYQAADDQEFDDEWLDTDCLRGMWARHTVLPKRWTAAQIRKLFEDLEDVNYHGFLSKLIDLIEQRLPHLAAALADWYKPAPKPIPAPTSAH